MLANNETGTLQPIKEISAIGHEHGIPLHTDAAQVLGKMAVDVNDLRVDFLSVAGHKLYAPKGIGPCRFEMAILDVTDTWRGPGIWETARDREYHPQCWSWGCLQDCERKA